MKRNKRKGSLTSQDLRILGATPGLMAHRIGPDGRSGLTALNAEERAIFDEMNANYTKLKNLIVQTRAATTLSEVEAIQWA